MRIFVKDICFSYASHQVLNEVTLEVSEGEILSIVGPNGSGKSTLLKCIARILKPKSGTVFLDGKDIAGIGSRELARLMGYVPQSAVEVFPFTVLETVLMGRKPHLKWGLARRDIEVASEVIKFMGIEGMAERNLDQLSGGQKQRVFIARALAQEPQIFLLDEPTSSLDIRHQLEVLETVRDLACQKNCLVIIVIHDLNLASRFSDKMVMLKDGQVFAAGEPETILTRENISFVYGVEAAVTNSDFGPYVVPIRPVSGSGKYVKAVVAG